MPSNKPPVISAQLKRSISSKTPIDLNACFVFDGCMTTTIWEALFTDRQLNF